MPNIDIQRQINSAQLFLLSHVEEMLTLNRDSRPSQSGLVKESRSTRFEEPPTVERMLTPLLSNSFPTILAEVSAFKFHSDIQAVL
ncbi:hypothetical protein CEXT_344951 [Caerostris extrusa]|uniref:Uncharacterized protein n=1 Tax=Caerostris extrusa TaxID=172846 RepID=A0AAV4UVM5_CAEEX|nr:hypothetical protein CEXT_344951 [Caerostris extrusa]